VILISTVRTWILSSKTNRFVPDKEFSGTDRAAGSSRSGPVQFEKDEDPFGLDQFLQQAKKSSKRGPDDKDKGGSSSAGTSADNKRRRRD